MVQKDLAWEKNVCLKQNSILDADTNNLSGVMIVISS